jgi:site-specific recombinase XerD
VFITAEQIKNLYLGKSGKQRTLLEVFDYHNNQMQAQVGKEYALGTYKRFEVTKKLVGEFILHQYAKSDLFLSELNFEFITSLEFFFKTVRQCNHNTALKYITNVRKITHLALLHGWLEQDPFSKFKCSFKETKRDHLTEEELTLLQEKEFGIERLEQVRDVFVFCCYTGLAYADVHKLTISQVGRGVDGKYWIFTDRTKTKTASNIPLLSPALALLDKYKDHPEAVNKGRLFPVSSNQKMNAYLKEIADVCGIAKTLTTHVARHTFATTVTLTNGVPLETVSSMLGHKNIKTTQIYAKVVQKKVSQDMETLQKQLTTKAQNDIKKRAM